MKSVICPFRILLLPIYNSHVYRKIREKTEKNKLELVEKKRKTTHLDDFFFRYSLLII